MDLLERYLQAVGKYLPEITKDDTLAELRANLLEQMDSRAEELGRPLDESDIAVELRAHGKPEVVALRYLPQRSLIGPTIFPFYSLTLVRVLPIVIFWSAVARGIQFVASGHETVAHALVSFAMGLCYSLLLTAAIITAIFAVIEWARERGKLGIKWNDWDPAKLPAVKAHPQAAGTPRSTVKRAIELAVHCVWMAYVLWVPWHPFWIMGPGVFYLNSLNVSMAPVWHTYYGAFLALLTAQLLMKLLAFLPPAQRWLAAIHVGTSLLGLLAVGILATASTYFVAAGEGAEAHTIATVNHWVGLSFRILFVLVLFGFMKEVWEYAKRVKPMQRLAF